jgi:aspartyl-tRNA(Asn)/glutamyl-tRNA(Gln) amidotransferase subunit B
MNGKALELAAKAGLALGSTVNERSLFSRKNYFYPDLPNGFQTSQLDPPICQGGALEIESESGPKTVRLNRIHLEDDAGKCVHDEKRGRTLVDLNRAGSPLIEIVTEPDLSSSAEAVEFLKKLHTLLVRLDVTEGRLEEGEFRCDVNISLKPKGSDKLGVRGEIKNLNSFRYAGQAIDYEIKRQSAIYESGGQVLQETLHFDPVRRETRTLRTKEEARDYRYFPQPDLPPVLIDREVIQRLKESLPKSSEQIMNWLLSLGLREETAKLITERKGAAEYFEKALSLFSDPKRLANLMAELFLPLCQKENILPLQAKMGPDKLASLARLMAVGTLGRRAAYELFPDLFQSGESPERLAKDKGLSQVSDPAAVASLAEEVIKAYPKEAKDLKLGKEKMLNFLVGKIMNLSKGTADPKAAGQAIAELIKNLP